MWHQDHCIWRPRVLCRCPNVRVSSWLDGIVFLESFAFSFLCTSGHICMKSEWTCHLISVSCDRPLMSLPIFQHLTVCFTQIDVDESLQCYRTFTLIGRNNKTVQQHVDSKVFILWRCLWGWRGCGWQPRLGLANSSSLSQHHCECWILIPTWPTFAYLWCLNSTSGVNKSVTVTLTALWQIQQMLIIHPSVLR